MTGEYFLGVATQTLTVVALVSTFRRLQSFASFYGSFIEPDLPLLFEIRGVCYGRRLPVHR